MRKDYTKNAELVLKLITKNGGDCSLRRNEGGQIDPTKPWEGEQVLEVGYPSQGVLLPLSMKEQSLYPELTVTKDNRKFLMEAIELLQTPKIGERILYKNKYWQIENVKQLKPADTVILWTLIVSQ